MDIMRLLEQINVRGTTVLMVTHAKDIVDKMNKRVVAIDHGRIVRDEEGSYGFEKQNVEDDIYVPGFTTFLDPQELIAAQAQIRRGNESVRGRTIAIPEPAVFDDSLVDTYLNGGEDVYE
jgi:ABC-type multidrug transport system ATPase subunit